MGKPDNNYRENPSRAIYVNGEINQALLQKITPEILRFRHESSDPITIYIDSYGGAVFPADIIRNIAQTPTPDGRRIRLITVVTGVAASAAADLLILGDYPIAYPSTRIIYHGTRRSFAEDLTVEAASSIAQSLKQTNEMFAARLARAIFERFVLRIMSLGEPFNDYANSTGNPNAKPLIDSLCKKISANAHRLVLKAVKMQDDVHELSTVVTQSFKKRKRKLNPYQFEIELLKEILRCRQKDIVKKKLFLSDGELHSLVMNFEDFLDFHFGDHRGYVNPWIQQYGCFFLSVDEKVTYGKFLETQVKERQAWLQDKTASKIRRLWNLTVSVCRILQTADYDLTPEDAFWLGMVGEVLGVNLPCERVLVEDAPDEVGAAGSPEGKVGA